VGEVVLDQVENLLLGLREPAEEVREGALRLGEELGQPAEELGEDDPALLEVGLRVNSEAVLGAVERPKVLAGRSRIVGGGRQRATKIRDEGEGDGPPVRV
jgi:hypothetical protein